MVHIADHHISPGKKLFTWGYNQLSRSWERALTDTDGQYAELMAGVYTDNQPNFSWLEPYETKTFSQYWYPISRIGTPDFANLDCALALGKPGCPCRRHGIWAGARCRFSHRENPSLPPSWSCRPLRRS